MSEITEQLWKADMGDIPMPTGCTYWQFAAARAELWRHADNDDAQKAIAELREIAVNRPELRQTVEKMINQEKEKFRL